MNKKYQVFISSTFRDLEDERKEVIQALLELDAIPVGMELFPAADVDQWTLIKNLINDCDYYILILGGRYGNEHPQNGISYTQMEYEYALTTGVPILGFIHKDPDNLPVIKTDKDEKKKVKLEEFRQLVQQKMCKHWETPADLGSVVSRSFVKLIKSIPRVGWVKADLIPSSDLNEEILKLKKENEKLKFELEEQRVKSPEGIENLKQGKDIYEIEFSLTLLDDNKSTYNEKYIKKETKWDMSWDDIFSYIGPLMINEASETDLKSALERVLQIVIGDNLNEGEHKFCIIRIHDNSFQQIKLQLRALGLIAKSIKNRSLKDNSTYWRLTAYGDNYIMRLKALK